MKIVLCSIGSQGDIQPFITLGKALQHRGHEVLLSSAAMYRESVEKAGLEYTSFEGDYDKIVDSEAMKKAIGKNPLTIKKKLKEEVYPIIENSLETFYAVSKWADVVVYHPKTLIDSFGYEFPEKLIKAYVVPAFTPTSFFPSPLFGGIPLNSFFYKLTYKITDLLIRSVKAPVKNFCRKHQLRYPVQMVDTPFIYGISPSFLPRPTDYPENHYFTGFWLEESQKNLSPQLQEFLKKPKKTIVITFGSMPYKSKIPINDFLHYVLRYHDIKIVVVRGWGLKSEIIEAGPNIIAVDHAPYDKLFSHVDGVVHHGGAGTTALALQAGIPSFICPVLYPVGDQLFWGKQVHKQQLGVKPVALSKLTLKNLSSGIGQLLSGNFSPTLTRIAKRIEEEKGLEKAVEIIERMEPVSSEWFS